MSDAISPTIGFVGLGRMGLPMAKRLARAGRTLLVIDLSPAAIAGAEEFGAAVGTSLQEIGKLCEIVITMLPNIGVVRSAVVGEDGGDCLLRGLASGDLVIDMSSSAPQGTAELGGILGARGVGFVDAPVSGGVRRAETGELSVMVGGGDADVERALPVLRDMGHKIFRTGPLGSGQAMKALNNLVSAAGLISSLEALLIGKQFGLDPTLMVDILNGSTGRNNSTENKLKQFILSRTFDSGFGLDLMVKDLRAALDLADDLGVASNLGALTLTQAEAAARQLGPGADHTAVAKYLEEVAGIVL